ncbi:MAG TPA: transporter substrate-binding domain-containing protein [Magnetospirillum sp.]|nr:transporter substrate-binding domain-containing protein [Magnetospirillum sp.]
MLKRFAMAALVAGAALAAPAAQADVITLRADEWCPYNCAEGSDKPGYGIEIAKEIFAKAGHTVEYKTMAWARALEEARKGTVMAVIGADKVEAADFVFPDQSVAVIDNTFVVKKGGAWKYMGVASLEKIKLAGIQGYSYSGEIGDYVNANSKNPARFDMVGGDNALEMNLKKLVAGRVDATVDAKPVLAYKLAQMGLADKVEFAGSVDPSDIYIAFSPANPKSKEYAQILGKGIADMRASGRLKQILDRYGVSDWK